MRRQYSVLSTQYSVLSAVFLCLCSSLCAAPQENLFTLGTASGKTLRGPLEEVRLDGSVRLGGAEGGTAAGAEVVALHRIGLPLPPPPRVPHVVLANGDRIPGRAEELAGQRLRFRSGAGAWELPLSAVSVLWQAAPQGPDAESAGRLLRRLATEPRTRDTVRLLNGDTVEGIVTGLDAKTLRLEAGKKVLPIDRELIAAVALNTELAATLRPRGSYLRLVRRDGARLSLASAELSAGKPLTGTTLFKAAVSVPVEDVVALYVLQGPAVYLSDLKPRRAEYNFFGGDAWPYVADGSVDRRDLCLAGGTYDKGLGTHSETRLTYDLSGRYRRFEALVGLDPNSGLRGSVRVKVLVDGKAQDIGADQELTARTRPLAVRVSVAGARELTLVVEFGDGGPVQDHVNWADARLIK